MAIESQYKKKITREFLVNTLKNFLTVLNNKEIGNVSQLTTNSKILVDAVNELLEITMASSKMVECSYSEFVSSYQHIDVSQDTKVQPFIASINESFTFNGVKYPANSYIYGVQLIEDVAHPNKYTYDWKVFANLFELIGDLTTLTTSAKDNLVNSINELDEKQGDDGIEVVKDDGSEITTLSEAVNRLNTIIGLISTLTTDSKDSIVQALNELDTRVGKINQLTTVEKESIVKAINSIADFIGDFTTLQTTDRETLVKGVNSNKKEIGNLVTLTDDIKRESLTEAVNETFEKSKVNITDDATQTRYSHVFTIKQNDKTLATINIPKDYYISNAVLYVATNGETAKDTEGNTLVKDYHYIKISIAQNPDILYINVESLYNAIELEQNASKIQLTFDPVNPKLLKASIVANSIDKSDLTQDIGKTLDFSGWINSTKPLDTDAQTLRSGVNELVDKLKTLREEFGKILDIDLPDDVTTATQAIQYLLTHKVGYINSVTYEVWQATVKSSAKAGSLYVITNDFTDPSFASGVTYKAGTWLYCIATNSWVAMNNGGGGIDSIVKEVTALPPIADAKSDVIYVLSDADSKKAYIKLSNANQWLLLNGGGSGGGSWLGNAYYYEAEHTNVKWEQYFILAGQQFLNDKATDLKGAPASEGDMISVYTEVNRPVTGDSGTYVGQYIFKNNSWQAYSQQSKASKSSYGVTKLATDEEFNARNAEYSVTSDQVLTLFDQAALKDDVYTKMQVDQITNQFYTKEQTYTKVEIEGLIASIRQVKHVATESEMRADSKAGTLYYVGITSPYAQWLCISAYDFLNLGTTDIDLSDYYKKQSGVTDQCLATLKDINIDKTIQEQLDGKMESATGAVTTILQDNLDKGKVVISNPFTGKIDVSTDISTSELQQLEGVDTTKTIQEQLNDKQEILVSGTNVKTINDQPLLGSGNLEVQEKLVSGTNIKTINNEPILGNGNITALTENIIKTIDGKSILITSAGDTDLEIIEDVTKINNTLQENRVYHLIKEQGGYEIGGYYIRNKYTDDEGSPQDEWVRLDNVVRADTITTVSSLVAIAAPLTSTIYRLKTGDGTYGAGYYIYYKNDAAGEGDLGTGFICISKDENSLQAGTGLEITAQGVVNHKNAITSGELNVPDNSGGITVPKVTYDAEGHISKIEDPQSIYAPNEIGTKGQILVSGGAGSSTSNTKPTWTSAGLCWYGVCNTSADVQAKEVTCDNFVLSKGHMISVKFAATNTITSPTLNVNATGAKTIYWGDNTINENNGWAANQTVTFIYDGTYYRVISVDEPECLWATCSTAVGTTAKVATVPGFRLYKGAKVHLTMTYPHISGTAATLNVNGTGAKTITRYGNTITTNNGTSWMANDMCTFIYDGTYWVLSETSNIPVGTICMFGGANIPAGWLYCNGSAVSATTYSKLYAVIGTTYGGNSTNFNLPDFRQRFPEGAGSASLTNAEYYNLGTKVSAGIPDIFGYFGTARGFCTNWGVDNKGATYSYGTSSKWTDGPSAGSANTGLMGFRASKGEVPSTSSTTISNLVYGKNKGVQPNALAVHFMIRYA